MRSTLPTYRTMKLYEDMDVRKILKLVNIYDFRLQTIQKKMNTS